MVKRKALRKRQQAEADRARNSARETVKAMPAALFAIKALSVFLALILVIALTLYIMKKMPARGFWVLAAMLAAIAFFVLPWMRRKFGG